MSQLFPLIIGLALFLGGHLISRLPNVKARLSAYFGPRVFRAIYSIWALMGLAMIVHGFGVYRAAGYIQVWNPPKFLAHLAIILVWLAFVLAVAGDIHLKGGRIKAFAKHPLLLAVKVWATAHLLANGDLGSMILFGSFLAWAVFARIALKKAGDFGNPEAGKHSNSNRDDLIAIVGGSILALLFMFWLHRLLIGVGIFGN
ncbi:COG4094 Predicted membrane protein [Rhabdaerophilaceae bacterium]